MEILFENEVIKYLDIPSIPKKEHDGKTSFENGVAILRLSANRKAYAVCEYNSEKDESPRVKKVFGTEPFYGIEKVFVVPSYMNSDLSDADLDAESVKRAEQLVNEATELENKGVVDNAIEKANNLPEWIFDEIHNRDEAIAWIRQYNIRNGIKKGKVPTNEETLKMRLYSIYMDNKRGKKQK